MNTLYSQIVTPITTTPYIRQIDNHYHTAMIAENTQKLVDYQRAGMRLQAEGAIANLRAMGEIARRQDVTNEFLGEIVSSISEISEGIEEINESLREGFSLIADRLHKQHETLLVIAGILRRPYGTQALELLETVDKRLKSGMLHTDRDREDDYADAMGLLRNVTENPIGNQNYVTHFQIGWLLWKHQGKIAEAEQAFHRAARLSEDETDLYHILSVRHESNMQYLQGRHEDAHRTIQKVLKGSRDTETVFDGARYAAKIGCLPEALRLLDDCIDINPATFVGMFAEPDFQPITADLVNLAAKKLHEAEKRAKAALAETNGLLRETADWRTGENAQRETHQAARDIEAARKLFDRGTFFAYLRSERLARSGIRAAGKALEQQQSALKNRLGNGIDGAIRQLEAVRPLARRHASTTLSEAEIALEKIPRHPSGYDGFMLAMRRLEQSLSLLQRVEAEGEANYLGKRKIGKGIGGIFGGVILGIVGWIVVGIAGAIVGLVVAIVMFICTLFGGDPHFSESIIQWCAWIGAGLGGVGGAVLGASGLGNTVGEWIKRE